MITLRTGPSPPVAVVQAAGVASEVDVAAMTGDERESNRERWGVRPTEEGRRYGRREREKVRAATPKRDHPKFKARKEKRRLEWRREEKRET